MELSSSTKFTFFGIELISIPIVKLYVDLWWLVETRLRLIPKFLGSQAQCYDVHHHDDLISISYSPFTQSVDNNLHPKNPKSTQHNASKRPPKRNNPNTINKETIA